MVLTHKPIGSVPGYNAKYICNFCGDPYTRKSVLEIHVCRYCPVLNDDSGMARPAPIVPIIPFMQLVSFEKGTGSLSTEKLVLMTKIRVNLVEFLIRATNLNPDELQYHNVLHAKHESVGSVSKTDINATKVQVFMRGQWVLRDMDSVIYQLINVKLADLRVILSEESYLDKRTKDRIQDTLVTFAGEGGDTVDARRELAGSIRRLLFEKRFMVNKTKERWERDNIMRAALAARDEHMRRYQ